MRQIILIAILMLTTGCAGLRLYDGQRDKAASEAFSLYKTIDINAVVAEQTKRYEKLEANYVEIEREISKSKRQAWLDELSYSDKPMSETIWEHVICGLEGISDCDFDKAAEAFLKWTKSDFAKVGTVDQAAKKIWKREIVRRKDKEEMKVYPFLKGRGNWEVEKPKIFGAPDVFSEFLSAAKESRKAFIHFGRKNPGIELPACYVKELVPDAPPIELERQIERVFKLRSEEGLEGKELQEAQDANTKIEGKRQDARDLYADYQVACQKAIDRLDELLQAKDSQTEAVKSALQQFNTMRLEAAERYLGQESGESESGVVVETEAECKKLTSLERRVCNLRAKIEKFDIEEKKKPDETNLEKMVGYLEQISKIGGFLGVETVDEEQVKSIKAVVDAIEGREVKDEDIKDKPGLEKAVKIASTLSILNSIAKRESKQAATQNLAMLLPELRIAEAELERIKKHRQLTAQQVDLSLDILAGRGEHKKFDVSIYGGLARFVCTVLDKDGQSKVYDYYARRQILNHLKGADSPLFSSEPHAELANFQAPENDCATYLETVSQEKLSTEIATVTGTPFFEFVMDKAKDQPEKRILVDIIGAYATRQGLLLEKATIADTRFKLFGYNFAMVNAAASAKKWDAVIRGPLMYMDAYYKRGIKAEELTQLLTLLSAISGIQLGTN